VTFVSDATLVPGDTNGLTDVFVHDRSTHVTTRASIASDGSQANGPSWEPTISRDGRYVAFRSGATNLVASDQNNVDDLFVHDLQTGQTTRINVKRSGAEARGPSWRPTLTAGGLLVAFRSNDTTLDTPDGGARAARTQGERVSLYRLSRGSLVRSQHGSLRIPITYTPSIC
jgi:Tol biopolymer transport system component